MRAVTRTALVAVLAGIMLTPALSHAAFGKRTAKIMTKLKAVHQAAMMNQTGFVDEDGDGVCDLCGNVPGSGEGANFIDEDGDGVCDNCGSVIGGQAGGYRTGEGKGTMDRDRLNDGSGENCSNGM